MKDIGVFNSGWLGSVQSPVTSPVKAPEYTNGCEDVPQLGKCFVGS